MRLLSAAACAALALAAPAASAHFTSSPSPHLHATDLAGLVAVVALTLGAGWLDRRRSRARRERDARRADASRTARTSAPRADDRAP